MLVVYTFYILFSKPKTSLMGRIKAKSRNEFVESQTTRFIAWFKQRHNGWACCSKSQGDCFEGDNIDWKVSVVVVMEKLRQSGQYPLTQRTQLIKMRIISVQIKRELKIPSMK